MLQNTMKIAMLWRCDGREMAGAAEETFGENSTSDCRRGTQATLPSFDLVDLLRRPHHCADPNMVSYINLLVSHTSLLPNSLPA